MNLQGGIYGDRLFYDTNLNQWNSVGNVVKPYIEHKNVIFKSNENIMFHGECADLYSLVDFREHFRLCIHEFMNIVYVQGQERKTPKLEPFHEKDP